MVFGSIILPLSACSLGESYFILKVFRHLESFVAAFWLPFPCDTRNLFAPDSSPFTARRVIMRKKYSSSAASVYGVVGRFQVCRFQWDCLDFFALRFDKTCTVMLYTALTCLGWFRHSCDSLLNYAVTNTSILCTLARCEQADIWLHMYTLQWRQCTYSLLFNYMFSQWEGAAVCPRDHVWLTEPFVLVCHRVCRFRICIRASIKPTLLCLVWKFFSSWQEIVSRAL